VTADELRAFCEARHLTRRALARLLGVHPITVTRWCTGTYPVPHWVDLAIGRL